METDISLSIMSPPRKSVIGLICFRLADNGKHLKRLSHKQFIAPMVVRFYQAWSHKFLDDQQKSAAEGVAEPLTAIERVEFYDKNGLALIFHKGKPLEVCAQQADLFRHRWIKELNRLADKKRPALAPNSPWHNAYERAMHSEEEPRKRTQSSGFVNVRGVHRVM